MSRIDLPEPYADNFAAQSVKDSLMSHGEEVVIIRTYHLDEDEGKVDRCPVCYDELYNQVSTQDCTYCYGTSFSGGVKVQCRAWAQFQRENDEEEKISAQGVFPVESWSIHTEGNPKLTERDYIVRIAQWLPGHIVGEVQDIYMLSRVECTRLRTGNRFGQFHNAIVGQKAFATKTGESLGSYKIPLVGIQFDRLDGRDR